MCIQVWMCVHFCTVFPCERNGEKESKKGSSHIFMHMCGCRGPWDWAALVVQLLLYYMFVQHIVNRSFKAFCRENLYTVKASTELCWWFPTLNRSWAAIKRELGVVIHRWLLKLIFLRIVCLSVWKKRSEILHIFRLFLQTHHLYGISIATALRTTLGSVQQRGLIPKYLHLPSTTPHTPLA